MLVWRLPRLALDRTKAVAPSRLAQELATSEDLGRFNDCASCATDMR